MTRGFFGCYPNALLWAVLIAIGYSCKAYAMYVPPTEVQGDPDTWTTVMLLMIVGGFLFLFRKLYIICKNCRITIHA